MRLRGQLETTVAIIAVLAYPALAHAQRASENAVTSADDAFGTNVGLESTGIYSENDARGFSPTKAGNVRVDGIYMDNIAIFAGRLRGSTAIRVGFSAEDYPFHAPTGIVDHKFRPFPDDWGLSLALHTQGYWGYIGELDFRVPVVAGHIGLTGGLARSDSRMGDGSGNHGYGTTVRPMFRFGGIEFSPFVSWGGFSHVKSHSLVVVTGGVIPPLPPERRYLGQPWALGHSVTGNDGFTLKAALTDRLSFRGGLLYSYSRRKQNYNEIFSLRDTSDLADHLLIADPEQEAHSTSGEAQLALRIAGGRWQHRFIVGFRGRNRYTETGGSAVVNSPNRVPFGEFDPIPETSYAFAPVNAGRVVQTSWLLGYTGKFEGVGVVNLGLQRARFRGTSRDGRTGAVTSSRDDLWLYNASLGLDVTDSISVYLGTEKGLEDSGTAPENAVNRNEQLPPTRSTQYEAGVRWRFHGGQLIVNVFQITKPYFSFTPTFVYTQLGQVRHRGIETSLSGHFGNRLSLVLGALFLQPRVTGGGRPAGTPSVYVRGDINYRTDLFGGLTPTATVIYTGSRSVAQGLTVPAYATVDLGLRQQFRIGRVPASIRVVVQNVFDAKTWKVVAANTLYPEERRRLSISLSADF
jgi:iron complex outermembrane receptor protein